MTPDPKACSEAYNRIHRHYAERTANRSGVRLMNHIDEGLIILDAIGADQQTKDAYCLHPLCQGDDDLSSFDPTGLDPVTVMYAMEYRRTANGYLSKHSLPSGGIDLSPLHQVNQMLIADKVQNRKDFLKHHLLTHPNSVRLNSYFQEWLVGLQIGTSEYARLSALIGGAEDVC